MKGEPRPPDWKPVPTHWPPQNRPWPPARSEEHTSELQSQSNLVCRLLLEKNNWFKSDASTAPTTSYVPAATIIGKLLSLTPDTQLSALHSASHAPLDPTTVPTTLCHATCS